MRSTLISMACGISLGLATAVVVELCTWRGWAHFPQIGTSMVVAWNTCFTSMMLHRKVFSPYFRGKSEEKKRRVLQSSENSLL